MLGCGIPNRYGYRLSVIGSGYGYPSPRTPVKKIMQIEESGPDYIHESSRESLRKLPICYRESLYAFC